MKKLNAEHIEDFLKFEEKYNTFDLQFKGKIIWPLIRYAVYDSILEKRGLAQRAVTSSRNFKRSKARKIRKVLRILKLFSSPLSIFKKADILIFNYERVSEIQGKNYNPLIWTVQDSLSKKYRITVVDIHGVDASGHENVIDFSGILSISRILSSLIVSFSSWNTFAKEIENTLEQHYKIEVDLSWIYSYIYLNQKIISALTKILIKLKRPRFLFFTDTACFSYLIQMSKEKGIISVDFQHAIQSGQNILYRHNPELIDKYRNFIPDHTLTFGDYWNKYFSKVYSTQSIGNSYHELLLSKHKDIKQIPNTITIISDGEMARDPLEKLALGIVEKIPNVRIYYKLRQDEFPYWKDLYSKEIQETDGITFVSNNNKNLYYYLKLSEYVIGINSTALIEALPLSNVLIYETGWFVEFMDFIESGHVLSAPNVEGIVEIIKDKRTPKRYLRIEEIFKSKAASNLESFVKKLNKKKSR